MFLFGVPVLMKWGVTPGGGGNAGKLKPPWDEAILVLTVEDVLFYFSNIISALACYPALLL